MWLTRNIISKTKQSLDVVRCIAQSAAEVKPQPPATTEEGKYPLLRHVNAEPNSDGILQMTWENGETTSFSSIFLRDCCRCSKCYSKDSQQRVLNTVADVPLDITPKHTDISSERVTVTWPDGHQSTYTHRFLWKRQHVPRTNEENEDYDIRFIKPVMWDSCQLEGELPRYDFNSVLVDDYLKFDWFREFSRYGIAVMQGAAKAPGELHRLKSLFGGYIKSTHYGETFQVLTKPDPSSLAYTSDSILPHMDLPHYEYPPGIQALHCIEQFSGPGADNTLVDGFNAARFLKQTDEEAFNLLTTFKVTYRDKGVDHYGDYETFYETPIIGLRDGEIGHISYSNWLRDYQMKGDARDIQTFYKAYYKFTNLLSHPRNVFTYKLKDGDILVFNNRRVLHGRLGFNSKEVNSGRFFEGCYFDWDNLYWCMRPVKRRLDMQSNSL